MENTNKKQNTGKYLTRWNVKQASLVAVLLYREKMNLDGTQIEMEVMKGGMN